MADIGQRADAEHVARGRPWNVLAKSTSWSATLAGTSRKPSMDTGRRLGLPHGTERNERHGIHPGMAPGMMDVSGAGSSTLPPSWHWQHAERVAYSTTKTALLGMVKANALRLGPYGITVNAWLPAPSPPRCP